MSEAVNNIDPHTPYTPGMPATPHTPGTGHRSPRSANGSGRWVYIVVREEYL